MEHGLEQYKRRGRIRPMDQEYLTEQLAWQRLGRYTNFVVRRIELCFDA